MRAKKWGAELLGTFLLVLGGCGSAIFEDGTALEQLWTGEVEAEGVELA